MLPNEIKPEYDFNAGRIRPSLAREKLGRLRTYSVYVPRLLRDKYLNTLNELEEILIITPSE